MPRAPLRQHVLKLANIFGIGIAAAVDDGLQSGGVQRSYHGEKEEAEQPGTAMATKLGTQDGLLSVIELAGIQ